MAQYFRGAIPDDRHHREDESLPFVGDGLNFLLCWHSCHPDTPWSMAAVEVAVPYLLQWLSWVMLRFFGGAQWSIVWRCFLFAWTHAAWAEDNYETGASHDSTKQPTNRHTNRPTDQPTHRPIDQRTTHHCYIHIVTGYLFLYLFRSYCH